MIKLILLFFLINGIIGCGMNAQIVDLMGANATSPKAEEPVVTDPDDTVTPAGTIPVSINQSITQPDPTQTVPVKFLIEFEKQIDPNSFTLSDVDITGTASGIAWTLNNSGDDKNFYLEAVSSNAVGNIIIDVPAGKVTASDGATNRAAQIIDNEVTIANSNLPFVLKNINTSDASSNPTDFQEIGNSVTFIAAGKQYSYNKLNRELSVFDSSKALIQQQNVLGILSNKIIFRGTTSALGAEVWVSDGTESGTHLVKDIAAGSTSSDPRIVEMTTKVTQKILNIFSNGPYIYFYAESSNEKLWRTDGTLAGTIVVSDLIPGSGTDNYIPIGYIGSRFYFIGENSSNGAEIYSTDGTTSTMHEWRTGSISTVVNRNVLILNDKILLSCNTGTVGVELCLFNGTSFVILKDINFGTGSSTPFVNSAYSGIDMVHNGIAYFTATTAATGRELWATDGTEENTVMLYNSNGTSNGTYEFYINLDLKNSPYFYFKILDATNGMQLYRSSGTLASVQLIKDLSMSSLVTDTDTNTFKELVFYNNNKFFFAVKTAAEGLEYWVTDGTSQGTQIIKDINPGVADAVIDSGYNSTRSFAAIGETVYFSAKGPEGVELWSTNGDPTQTKLVKDIYVGNQNASNPQLFVDIGEEFIFVASNISVGTEPWISLGTTETTLLLKNIATEDSGSNPRDFNIVGGKLYFIADTIEAGTEIASTNGAPEFTATSSNGSLIDLLPGSADLGISQLRNTNGKLAFIGTNTSKTIRKTLWMSDGTVAGSQMIDSGIGDTPFAGTGTLDQLTRANGHLYFRSTHLNNSISGLWKTDNTPSGTQFVSSSYNFTNFFSQFISWGSNLIFYNGSGTELGFSDGGSTTVEHDLRAGAFGSSPQLVMSTPQYVYFRASSTGVYHEIYKSDGTFPVMLADINTTNQSHFTPLLTSGNDLWFFATPDNVNSILYKTDGTTTSAIKTISSAAFNLDTDVSAVFTAPIKGAALGSQVVFVANDGVFGSELWISDGTSVGTLQLKDIHGSGSSNPENFFVYSGKIYFTADDGIHGRELWVTDGTSVGTTLVSDLNPGALSSNPKEFIIFNSKMYFSADNVNFGRELWVLPNP